MIGFKLFLNLGAAPDSDTIECSNQRSRVNDWDVSPKLRKLNPIINRTIYELTDGYDNRSGLSITNLRSAMKTNKLFGSFNAVFLAANLGNAQEIGASMGFNPNTSLTIDAGRQRSSNGMQAANSLLRAISSGSSAPPGFTQLQRQSSQPVDHITAPINLRIRRTRNAIPVGIHFKTFIAFISYPVCPMLNIINYLKTTFFNVW